MTAFLLLVGCGLGAGPTAPDAAANSGAAERGAGVDTGVEGDTAVDTGDSGGDTSLDTVPDDTGTGDTAVDTAVDTGGDSDACDPAPYLRLDTGLDTGAGPAVEVRTDQGVVDERYVEETTDDCDVSTVSAGGDPLLECLGTTLDLATEYGWGESTVDWAFEWAGDLDEDGHDDVLLTGTEDRLPDVYRFLFYGAPEGVPAGVITDPATIASAIVDPAEVRATSGYGDLDGDGYRDLVVASDAIRVSGTSAGVIFGDGVRQTGTLTTLGAADYWSEAVSATSTGWAGDMGYGNGSIGLYPREVSAVDLDKDGADELMFPSKDDYLLAAIRGQPGLAPSGPFVDAAAWTVTQDEHCWWVNDWDSRPVYYECWQARSVPVGDLDGDGSATVAMMLAASEPISEPGFGEAGEQVALVSLTDFPACVYEWEDVADTVLAVGTSKISTFYSGYSSSEGMSTPIAVQDLDGDGLDDLVVVARTRDDYESVENDVAWILYGGERWLRFGGGLESATDRIEFPKPDDAEQDWKWSPATMYAADLSGDSLDELIVGGTYASDTIGLDDGAFYGRAHLDVIRGQSGGLRGVHDIEDSASLSLVGPPDSVFAHAGRGRGDFDGDGAEDLLVWWTYRWWSTGFDGSRLDDYSLDVGSMINSTDIEALW